MVKGVMRKMGRVRGVGVKIGMRAKRILKEM